MRDNIKAFAAMSAGVVLTILFICTAVRIIERHHDEAMHAKVAQWNQVNAVDLTPAAPTTPAGPLGITPDQLRRLPPGRELTDAEVGIGPDARLFTDAELGLPPRTRGLTDAEVGLTNDYSTAPEAKPKQWSATLEFAYQENGVNVYRDPNTLKSYYTDGRNIYEYVKPEPKPVSATYSTITYSQPEPVRSISAPTTRPISSLDPNSLDNPYGAGSPYKADGLMNPFSQYGSPYSNKSWRNPYATDPPKLYDANGNYRGKLSANSFDPDSVSNPFGRYGNPFSPDSINNQFGAGNPFGPPVYVVPSE